MKNQIITSGCGIVGSINCDTSDSTIQLMTDTLSHRGPNGGGVWSNNDGSVRFGHRRLAIIGIDVRGNQPMTRRHVTLTCNGEIYNYLELRHLLKTKGYHFISDCDTEVLIHAYLEWGMNFLSKINGIFAFALYDDINKNIILARDPVGVKPLVYTETNFGKFLFASEVKALLVHPEVSKQPNFNSIRGDILHGLLGQKQETWFNNIHNLEPGHIMVVDCLSGISKVFPFWSYPNHSTLFDEKIIISDLRDLLESAVELQMASDVGISTTCSGGIDSAAITVLAAQKYKKSLDVFSLTYEDEPGHSPAKEDLLHAKKMLADCNNVCHNIITVSMQEILNKKNIDNLVYAFDGAVPFDIRVLSFVKLYDSIHKLGHKVVLTGQGADELWMGYYDDLIYTFYKNQSECLSAEYLVNKFFNRIPMGQEAWNPNFINESINLKLIRDNLSVNYQNFNTDDPLARLSYFVIKTHFQSILNMDDKIAMMFGLEPRVPWVDKRLLEMSFKVPSYLKLNSNDPTRRPKHLIQEAVNGLVPNYIIERKKSPFPNPQSSYKNILKSLINTNLEEIKKSSFIKEIFTPIFLANICSNDNLVERNLFTIYVLWRFGNMYFG